MFYVAVFKNGEVSRIHKHEELLKLCNEYRWSNLSEVVKAENVEELDVHLAKALKCVSK